MSDGGFRRVLPPSRRRPTVLTVLVRWRAEALLLIGLILLYAWADLLGLGAAAGLVVTSALVPPVRRGVLGAARAVVACHRVRSGLVQAGVTDRSGRLPWIVGGRPRGTGVIVHIWLRSGTTTNDLREALPLVRTACGAASVELTHSPLRPDRAVLVVHRPRWGWPRTGR